MITESPPLDLDLFQPASIEPLPAKNDRVSIRETKFQEDLNYWRKNCDRLARKVDRIVKEIMLDPFHGIGKPEPLKGGGDLSGCWSRRLTKKHRIVYRVLDDRIIFIQCRLHY
jgi:toxin YoeB